MTENTKKTKRIKPDLPGGFRDYGPQDAIAKQNITDTIRQVFESFGFDPLETSAVQRTEVLTGGEEDSDKIIYRISPAQRGEIVGDEKKEENSLRFDLTVPLARFIATNPDLPKPFKRYEIGRVWRGERSQAGRYREFMQADADIIGESGMDADAEIAQIAVAALRQIGIDRFIIGYNNRKILNALPSFAGFPDDKLWSALRIIDKKDKIGDAGMNRELKKEFGAPAAKKIAEFLRFEFSGANQDNEGVREYAAIRQALASGGDGAEKYLVPSPSLVRGLSYYTGSVFEVLLPDAPEIGSVGGGGRYDGLVAQFTGQKIPAVGISIGVDRLYAAMEKLGTLKRKTTLIQVLILRMDENLTDEYRSMANALRAAGIPTALYLGDDRSFQAQLAYAVKKEIPNALIYGEREKIKGIVTIKNLAAREQKEIPKENIAEYFGKISGMA